MKKRLILFTLLLLVAVQVATAQKTWDEIEFPEINNFDIPDIATFTLPNGVQFFLVEDDELPVINLSLTVRTGSFLVSNEKTGLASMTGNVMRTGGSVNYPEEELNELLENRAARIEAGIGLTSGSASMNVLKEDFDELLDVFIDVITNPAFPEDRIDLTKTQRKTGIARRNDDQGSIANREFRRLIYGEESVYGRLTEYATIDNITREDMIDFHNRSFVGSNMMVGVVGDFTVAEIRPVLERAFGQIEAGEPIELDLPEVNYEFQSGINFIDKQDVNQSYVLLGHVGGLRDNPDYAKLQVMNQLLSGGFSSRLFQEVRTRQGLAYAVFGSYGSNNFYPGTFTAGVMTQSETTADAIDSIISEIGRLQDEPVSDEELAQTKDQFLNSLVFRYVSRAGILNQRLGYEYAGLDPDSFDRLVEEIREVTPDDVQEVAQRYLRPDALQILVVGNSNELGDQLAKYGDVNEIDITIPEPQDDEVTGAGDAAAGAEWLNRLSEAVMDGGTFDGLFVQEGVVNLDTPMGAMSLKRNERIDFREKAYHIEMRDTPQGNLTFDIKGSEGVLRLGDQEIPLQPMQIQQQTEEYATHYLNILLHRDTYTPEFIGMVEVDGEQTAHLRLSGEKNLNFYINPDTGLPVKMEFRQFAPQMGGQVTVTYLYEDWKTEDGVAVPYRLLSIVDGNQQAEVLIETHSVE
ncbi:MAG: M16 family metallopeptidase [Balneolaceae bacterium]